MERADAEEGAGDPAIAIVGVADLVGVTAQSNTGGTGLFSHGLANGSYTGAHDGHGQQTDDEYCGDLWFHYLDVTKSDT